MKAEEAGEMAVLREMAGEATVAGLTAEAEAAAEAAASDARAEARKGAAARQEAVVDSRHKSPSGCHTR